MQKYEVVESIIGRVATRPEPEAFGPEAAGIEWDADTKEHPAHEGR